MRSGSCCSMSATSSTSRSSVISATSCVSIVFTISPVSSSEISCKTSPRLSSSIIDHKILREGGGEDSNSREISIGFNPLSIRCTDCISPLLSRILDNWLSCSCVLSTCCSLMLCILLMLFIQPHQTDY